MSNYLLISDQEIQIPELGLRFIDCSEKEPHKVFEEQEFKEDAIFINAEAKINGSNRSDLKGIELIFWLRLKYKYTGPIVVYGFLSSAQVLRLKPRYIAIHAPGNMYWRLGDKWEKENMPPSITEKQITSEYRPYLLPLNVENNLRHEHANIWGLWQYTKTFFELYEIRELPEFAKKNNKKLESDINFQISKYLFNQLAPSVDDNFKGDYQVTWKSLGEHSKKILLVDDMADIGWSILLKYCLNVNGEEEVFEVLDNFSEDLTDQIVEKIEEKEINLILLDLRLKNEKGNLDIEDISGYQVLKGLKEKRPDIPIVIITASNKLQTNKALEQMGVWGVWTKEGQDNNMSPTGLGESLLSLLNMVKGVYDHFTCPADYAIYGVKHIIKSELYKNDLREDVKLDTIKRSNGIIEVINNKHNLNAFDSCIVDTCALIQGTQDESCKVCTDCKNDTRGYSDNCKNKTNYFPRKDYIQQQLVVQGLSEIFSVQKNKKLLIHNHVFSELRKKARPIINEWDKQNVDPNIIATASFALDRIEHEMAQVVEYDSRTYNIQAYADPRLIDYLLAQALGLKIKGEDNTKPKNILLITNDNDLITKVSNLTADKKRIRDTRNKSWKWKTNNKIIHVETSYSMYKKLFTSDQE